jgi:hypothetical protein
MKHTTITQRRCRATRSVRSCSPGCPRLCTNTGAAAGKDGRRTGERIERRDGETQPGGRVVFGYDYFADYAQAAGIPTPRLLSYEGPWGWGEEYAYEALNFADGSRSARQITDALSVEYGPIPQELVTEYLQALEKIGILQRRPLR